MVGKRAMRLAVLVGAISSMVQALPDQQFREQLVELAARAELEADELLSEFDLSDELLSVAGLKSA